MHPNSTRDVDFSSIVCPPPYLCRLLLPSYFYSALISSRSRREQRLKSHTIHEKQYPRCLYVISDTLNPFLLVSHCTTQIYISSTIIITIHTNFTFTLSLFLCSSPPILAGIISETGGVSSRRAPRDDWSVRRISKTALDIVEGSHRRDNHPSYALYIHIYIRFRGEWKVEGNRDQPALEARSKREEACSRRNVYSMLPVTSRGG